MFLQNLRAKVGARLNGDSEAGFTLIELLVVMLILGILAAIAIPAFFNQREKATDAQAKSAARTAETAMETYATESSGEYTGATSKKLHEIEPTLVEEGKGANEVKVSGLAAKTFKVESVSGTGIGFSIARNAEGEVTFDCTEKVNGKGGCPKGGNWSK
ncbi:MAG TPA: type II secretion system protein [Solirubrobacterales bacterium]|nr:type II secretion system protein [Solirubrobacterales bacterium]